MLFKGLDQGEGLLEVLNHNFDFCENRVTFKFGFKSFDEFSEELSSFLKLLVLCLLPSLLGPFLVLVLVKAIELVELRKLFEVLVNFDKFWEI